MAYRPLTITKARNGRLLTKGEDVRLFQAALGRRIEDMGLDDFDVLPPKVDGVFGITTLVVGRTVAREMGLADVYLSGPLDPHLQQIVRKTRRRSLSEWRRSRRRLAQRRKRRAALDASPDTNKEAAEFLLRYTRRGIVQWSTWLSTGSDEARLHEIVNGTYGGRVKCPHTGALVWPNKQIMLGLVALAKEAERRGTVFEITALTGGKHTSGSRHYIFMAIDLRVGYGLASYVIQQVLARFGGHRNYETNHIHEDF